LGYILDLGFGCGFRLMVLGHVTRIFH